jgi:hypothetical protein
MKKQVFIYAILLIVLCACDSNGLGNSLPQETVELSESAGEVVDLGLSVKWASSNVDYYYYWASTQALRDYDEYDWDDPYDKSFTCHTGSKYDVARMAWGGSWRTPTDAEWRELKTKCTVKWDGQGMKVTGPSGKSIYLPANAPYGRYAIYYWTSSRIRKGDWEGAPAAVYISEFGMTNPEPCHENNQGRVRPVCDK